MEMKDIAFDERFYNEEHKEWHYYFTAPAKNVLEMFPGRYDPNEVIAAELSIEFPCKKKTEYDFGNLDGVIVSISPMREADGELEDYDWEDIDIPDSEILELLEKAARQSFAFEEYWNSGLIIRDLCVPGACPLCDDIKECISETTFATLESMSNGYDIYDEIKAHAKQLYNRTCKMNGGRTMFKVHISEVLGRTVVIFAGDEDEAYELAEELCNNGVIDLNGSDFGSRTVEVVSKAVPEDLEKYENYEEEDE